MKIFNIILGFVLSSGCVASTLEEAYEKIYIYALYDLDVSVWGVGKGYVATGCAVQSRSDKKCTFNEFVNYIQTGKATDTPSYYELPSGFYFTFGSIAQIADALNSIVDKWEDAPGRIISGRKTLTGLRKDMARTLQLTVDKAKTIGYRYTTRVEELKRIMDGMILFQSSRYHSNMIDWLKGTVSNLEWEVKLTKGNLPTVPIEIVQIDWNIMVRKYPSLLDPSSKLSQALTNELNEFYKHDLNSNERDAMRMKSEISRVCLRPQ
jgi:hypothetical protein